jgi:hypothetical protein
MINKLAINNVRQKGFDSKAQMRFLLMLAKTHPSKYQWVYEVLRDHGVPTAEKIEPAYWEAPYNVSPDTPSYTYKSTQKSKKPMRNPNLASIIGKVLKVANKLDLIGRHIMASKLDRWATRRVDIDIKSALEVANSFWSLRKNELSKDPEELVKWFDTLEYFESYINQNSETKEEIRRILSDKILGRA